MKELTIKSIEKIKITYDLIKKLDAEIIELDKMGMLISEKRTEINITLGVMDMEEINKAKVAFDEDGSLYRQIGRMSWGGFAPGGIIMRHGNQDEKTNKPTSSVNYILSETTAYLIIGTLMAEKQRERDQLIGNLERYGVKI